LLVRQRSSIHRPTKFFRMSWSSSQQFKFALAGLGLLLILAATLVAPPAAANRNSLPGRLPRDRKLSQNPDLLHFKRGALDTRARADLDTSAGDRDLPAAGSFHLMTGDVGQLRVVQFRGPMRREWMKRLEETGAKVIGYVPNNAYIIRGNARQIARVAALDQGEQSDDDHPVQWMGRLDPLLKLDLAFDDDLLARGQGTVEVEIELIDSTDTAAAIERVGGAALKIDRAPRRFLSFIVLSVTLAVERLLEIAGLEEVIFVGPAARPRTHDERSAQIVATNLAANGVEPAGPGYKDWLRSKGLDTRPDFLIDFTDTGLDRGSTSEGLIHPDFLDSEGHSRVAYNINYAQDQSEDRPGHGTLVASIGCGSGSAERTDAAGYMYGLGVDPVIRFGASRIFSESGKLPFVFSFTNVAATAYSMGARISNNSWGNRGNSYDVAAQEFDALTRDAQPAAAGNQEMVFIFSAGNGGAGGFISSPGTAKNVITVAASENFRPEGFDSCNLDGEGAIGPEGANSALDILRFSSGGPTFDGRIKPDITAPGTHIFGAASQTPRFNADGLCPGTPIYQPPGQRFYTWSSGTSLAAPHISGAASLLRRLFTRRNLLADGRAPSPAMTKAYLTNSATYLTGENAGGDLPAPRQGWGLVSLARAFNESRRILLDQTKLFSESGQVFEIHGSLLDRSLPLRVTLAWTDAPGSLASALTLVNDLDLEITVGGVTVYRGNNFAGDASTEGGEPDRLNNIESIYLPAGLIPEGHMGNFTITVRAANIAADGVPGNGPDLDQDFALVITNITDPIPEPEPEPTKKVPFITSATYAKKVLTISGRDFTAAARVEINSQIISKSFAFNTATNSLSIKLKARKLKLNTGADNQIVLIENNERSLAFTLRL
jgi:subtilisin family serine protease